MGSMNTGPIASNAGNRSPMEWYDNLPPRIRQLFRDAPYDFSTRGVAEYVEFNGEDRAFHYIASVIASTVPIEAAHAYGPDHPQAK